MREMGDRQCEICGADISGSPERIVIDGSVLEVCKSCARFGKPEDKWSPVPRKIVPVERSFRVQKPKPRDHFRDFVEVVPDYGNIIKNARESMNLSLEDLALRIKEKASLLRKIEREELVPEDDVRKKLEKELRIKLTEETTEERLKSKGGSKVLTLGDIANIRKR